MTTKTYAFKSDAKKAAIKSGASADDINLYQTNEGRWTWSLHSEHEAVWEAQHPTTDEEPIFLDAMLNVIKPARKNRAPRTPKAKTTKTPAVKVAAQTKTTTSTKVEHVRFSAQVIAKLGKRASKIKSSDIDKTLVKSLIGEMDDRKARRIARQVVRSLNA